MNYNDALLKAAELLLERVAEEGDLSVFAALGKEAEADPGDITPEVVSDIENTYAVHGIDKHAGFVHHLTEVLDAVVDTTDESQVEAANQIIEKAAEDVDYAEGIVYVIHRSAESILKAAEEVDDEEAQQVVPSVTPEDSQAGANEEESEEAEEEEPEEEIVHPEEAAALLEAMAAQAPVEPENAEAMVHMAEDAAAAQAAAEVAQAVTQQVGHDTITLAAALHGDPEDAALAMANLIANAVATGAIEPTPDNILQFAHNALETATELTEEEG